MRSLLPAVCFVICILTERKNRICRDIIAFLSRSVATVDAQILHRALQQVYFYDVVGALHIGAQLAAIYAKWQKRASEAASTGRGSEVFHSATAAMVDAGGSGTFAPTSTFVDTDGVGPQYFLNIVNALLQPIVYQPDPLKKETSSDTHKSLTRSMECVSHCFHIKQVTKLNYCICTYTVPVVHLSHHRAVQILLV